MNATPTATQEYLKSTVMTASPEQLQLMLYEAAIRYSTRGKEALEARDREGAFNALDRAQQIVLELSNGLRRDVNPVLADQMAALYSFVYRRLIDGNVQQDAQAIEDALRILRHQRDTWELLMQRLRQQTQQTASPQRLSTAPSPSHTADTAPSFTAEG